MNQAKAMLPRKMFSEIDRVRFRPEIARLRAENRTCRITIVRSGGLGDTVLLLPTIRLLTHALPNAEITLVGSSWAQQLLSLIPVDVGFVQFGSSELSPLFAPGGAEDRAGVFAEADLVIIYTSRERGPLLRNARALCSGKVLDWPVNPSRGTHAACHFAAALLDREPAVSDIPMPVLRVRPGTENDQQFSGRTAAVHPGSGGRHKMWPPRMFANFIHELQQREVRVLMLEGPADAAVCSEVVERLPQGVSVLQPGRLPLADCAGRIAACDVYIGNDSGLTHVAAALGVPTVAVFGPTEPSVWRPLGAAVRTLYGHGYKAQKWPEVRTVLRSVLEILDKGSEG